MLLIKMKKIFILMFLFLITTVGASHIPELLAYPKLQESIEFYLGNHDAKFVKLDYSREVIVHKENLTTLKLNIKHKNFNKLLVYDILPKGLDAQNDILDFNTNYTILENNVILDYIPNFKNDFTIEYLIKGSKDYDVNEIKEPLFIKPINLPDSRITLYILSFFSIILIIYIINKIRSIRLRGVRIR